MSHVLQPSEANATTERLPESLPVDPSFTTDELQTCLKVLQAISEKPAMMNNHDRFKGLVTKIHRAAKKEQRDLRKQATKAANRLAIESTNLVRNLRSEPHLRIGSLALCLDGGSSAIETKVAPAKLQNAQSCYVCKTAYTELHTFYHQLCPECAEFNWEKRTQRADLTNRRALVTGARIKIGFQTALKLLRDGCSVIVTTRFAHDAANRFQAEPDFAQWKSRLQIYALDLRNIPSVEAFASEVSTSHDSLDILIHNAAQTVKRPLAYYQQLLSAPCNIASKSLICSGSSLNVLLESRPDYNGQITNVEQYFPKGLLDSDGQQVDNRPVQSWLLKLEDVGTLEMLEVYLVNAAAPFILTRRLLPLLRRSPHARKFVVNVSAMEGQFARVNKTAFHPHTNMAKAALNMLTRTSSEDLAQDSIYMNSVDTGWITDEKPTPMAERVRNEHGFYPPLDIIDGASRVYDPIARGCNEPDEPWIGQFLKDYQPFAW